MAEVDEMGGVAIVAGLFSARGFGATKLGNALGAGGT